MNRDSSDDRDDVVEYDTNRDLKSTSSGSLSHLGDLDDVQIAEDKPDIRGWDVKDSDGRLIGKVTDLLVDTGPMKVRYLEVKLDKAVARETGVADAPHAEGVRDREEDDWAPLRHVLVPIGAAHLDDAHDDVLLATTVGKLAGIPPYQRGSLTREYETGLVGSFTSSPADRAPERREQEDFYADSTFDDRPFLARRRPVRDDMTYLTKSGTSRASGTMAGGGPLLSDATNPTLDPRPGGVGDPRL